ncbi:MAG: 1,4-dihydroxy-6-naphthoate synthase [Chitinophagaceae bacterium]
MTVTIGFSPCPNDTFIFDALINKKIDTGDLSFEAVLEDVQTLNSWAIAGKLAISKISYAVLPLVLKEYIVLNAGGALGKGVGPLLISKNALPENETINKKTIAIPGENTTAHMLFALAYPEAQHKKFMIFSAIEDAVIKSDTDMGVIIHENRFTYQQKGLTKIIDLGAFWEQATKLPIPLGGIVAKRNMETALQKKIDLLIRQSVEYAFSNYPGLADYVKKHSQEMEEGVMRQHIDLYVNNYSIALGDEGKKAVQKLLEVYNIVNKNAAVTIKTGNLFVE